MLTMSAAVCLSFSLVATIMWQWSQGQARGEAPSIIPTQPSAAVPPEEDFTSSQGFEVTIATQCTANRAWLLGEVCDRWPGPVSAAVLSSSPATLAEMTAACGVVSPSVATQGAVGSLLGVALVRQGRLALTLWKTNLTRYPINAMRNAALAAVKTSHVLAVDVDFLPSIELYSALRAQSDALSSARGLAVVVPAFQRKGNPSLKDFFVARDTTMRQRDRDALAPATVNSLALCLAAAKCIVFDATWNPDAHSTTDSAAWLEEAGRFAQGAFHSAVGALRHRPVVLGRDPPATLVESWPPLRQLPCFLSSRFEPFVVLKTSEAPAFNETFEGYGKNKIEYVARLRYSGFAFAVLPVGFVCHVPHPISRDKRAWLKKSRGSRDVDAKYKSSVNDMVARVKNGQLAPDANHTWLCSSRKSTKRRSGATRE